jgi:Na+-driven multidrug efflux pump
MILLILIIGITGGGEAGVAVYNTGWRVVMIAVLPLLGMATAVTTVTGATYGAQSYKKLNTAYVYAAKVGFAIELMLALIIFILAPYIAALFTTQQGVFTIQHDLENFLRISCLFYPGAAFGIISSAMFQGIGKGLNALLATLLRTLILTVFLAYFFSIVLNIGITGIWWGLVVSNLIGSTLAFGWGKLVVNKLMKKQPMKQPS